MVTKYNECQGCKNKFEGQDECPIFGCDVSECPLTTQIPEEDWLAICEDEGEGRIYAREMRERAHWGED